MTLPHGNNLLGMLNRQQVTISLLITANRQQIMTRLVLHTSNDVINVSSLVAVTHVVIRNVG